FRFGFFRGQSVGGGAFLRFAFGRFGIGASAGFGFAGGTGSFFGGFSLGSGGGSGFRGSFVASGLGLSFFALSLRRCAGLGFRFLRCLGLRFPFGGGLALILGGFFRLAPDGNRASVFSHLHRLACRGRNGVFLLARLIVLGLGESLLRFLERIGRVLVGF